MFSIGNDIVALDAIDIQRTIHPSFYTKIITQAELTAYAPATMPLYQYIWLLWSVKEAAYKYAARLNPSLIFAPIRIEVRYIKLSQKADDTDTCLAPEDGPVTAEIVVDGINISTWSFITANYIYSFACTVNFEKIHWGITRIADAHPTNQSAMVRQLALQALQSVYPGCHFVISKSTGGVPLVIANSVFSPNIALSFSHHGHYIGYAFVVDGLQVDERIPHLFQRT